MLAVREMTGPALSDRLGMDPGTIRAPNGYSPMMPTLVTRCLETEDPNPFKEPDPTDAPVPEDDPTRQAPIEEPPRKQPQ